MKYMIRIFACCIFLCSSSIIAQKDSINAGNAKALFKKLADNGGTWIAKNEKFDPNNKNDFSEFIMEFTTDEFGALNGTISGINANNKKVVFWKILEFINSHTGETVFIQYGEWGHAVASSQLESESIRKSEFELTYYNGAKEKHRDVHTFLDENTIQTESEIYDTKAKKWIKQPSQKWKRKL